MGVLPANPLASVPRPKPRRSIPKHWSPDEARQFLALHEGDRLWPVWAFCWVRVCASASWCSWLGRTWISRSGWCG